MNTTTPALRARVSDPDGGTLKALFEVHPTGATTAVATGTGAGVNSGEVSTLTSIGPLANGQSYTFKARANDGALTSKSYSSAVSFGVDTTMPALPTISATGYKDGWAATNPVSSTVKFTSTSPDVMFFRYSIDRGTDTLVPATGTGPRTATMDFKPTGAHEIRVRAIDRAGNETAAGELSVSSGYASLASPRAGATTSDAFTVKATAPNTTDATGVSAEVFWREAGRTESADDSLFGSVGTDYGWKSAKTVPVTREGTTLVVNTTLDVATEPTDALKNLGKDECASLKWTHLERF